MGSYCTANFNWISHEKGAEMCYEETDQGK